MKILELLQSMLVNIGQKIQRMDWVKDATRIIGITYEAYVTPVINFFKPYVGWIFSLYAWAFKKLAFVDGGLSHRRAGLVAVPVLAFSSWFIVSVGIPETYDFAVDGAGVLTERSEHVFLTGAGPVPNAPDDTFQAKGCSNLPCTEDTAMYYHIRHNSVKSLVNFVTKGTFYYPEEVEAAIPDQLSECDITIQWFRWRLFKMYNTITEVSCMPVSEGK